MLTIDKGLDLVHPLGMRVAVGAVTMSRVFYWSWWPWEPLPRLRALDLAAFERAIINGGWRTVGCENAAR